MGPDATAGTAGDAAGVEGEQLQPVDAGSAGCQRAAQVRGRGTRGKRCEARGAVLSTRRASALRRERTAALRIPYTAHVAERVVKTALGRYLQAFRLGGASFESADDEQLNNWHERLNVLSRNIASPNVALWTHIVRRRETPHIAQDSTNGFADALQAKYRRRLAGETLMVNE